MFRSFGLCFPLILSFVVVHSFENLVVQAQVPHGITSAVIMYSNENCEGTPGVIMFGTATGDCKIASCNKAMLGVSMSLFCLNSNLDQSQSDEAFIRTHFKKVPYVRVSVFSESACNTSSSLTAMRADGTCMVSGQGSNKVVIDPMDYSVTITAYDGTTCDSTTQKDVKKATKAQMETQACINGVKLVTSTLKNGPSPPPKADTTITPAVSRLKPTKTKTPTPAPSKKRTNKVTKRTKPKL
jgi:hypothetical protein